MNIFTYALAAFALCSFFEPTMADEFWKEGEPGHRGSFGDPDTEWTPELDAFIQCSLREYLDIEFVEACAIFKEDSRHYLECRYHPETYENFSSTEIGKRQKDIVNICSTETLTDKTSGGVLSRVWSALFGD